jgi:chemotaxis protein MotB
MVSKKKPEESSGGAPEWMCTFSDMMSLLLCFFVLLFSLSTIEKVKFVQAIGSIQGALGRIPMFFNTSYKKPVSIEPQKVEPLQNTKVLQRAKEAIAKKARSKLVVDEASREVIIEGVDEGIRFSLAGRILFLPGLHTLTEEGKHYLLAIAETLNDFPDLKIRVEGHTDNGPVSANSPFRDNWRLAEARSFSALAFLRDVANVQEERFSFMSCGEYRPRFPNDTPENQALNRRIEIVLLQGSNSEYIMGELQGSEDRKVKPNERDFVPNL